MSIAIHTDSVHKTFSNNSKTIIALNDINIDIDEGELFGLIGPDGAGKTTLFRILTTLMLADSGTAIIDGKDVKKDHRAIRKIFGYMPGKFSLYQDLSVEENLEFFATIFDTKLDDNYELISDIYEHIAPFKNRRAGALSGGMKQKLALCCALIHRPKILFLDEPTTGVDAISRKEFWEMLKGLQSHGITIMVSTPYMDEAYLCDRVALIQNGKILNQNNPQNIIHSFTKKIFAIRTQNKLNELHRLRSLPETERAYPYGEFIHWVPIAQSDVTDLINDWNQSTMMCTPVTPSIEDVFIDLMTHHG